MIESHPETALFHIRLAECLVSVGQPEGAEKTLRRALRQAREGDRREVWNRWLALSFVDLGLPPSEVLARVPLSDQDRFTEDVRWLLDALTREGAVRINSGALEDEVDQGKTWRRDCFYDGGNRDGMFYEVSGTDRDWLYQQHRQFSAGGKRHAYAIPLPPGRYRVTLHLAEPFYSISGIRVFDVEIEGEKVLEDYRPGREGRAIADPRSWDIPVIDGILDINFVAKEDSPDLAGIEVARLP